MNKREVIIAKTAGFCFGVKTAVNKAFELAETGQRFYTFGPIIHNDEVVHQLEEKGAVVLNTEDELMAVKDGIVILRSHGVPRRIIHMLDEKKIPYIDVACPFVKRIHDTVYEKSKDHNIVIIGNPHHPEVEGIVGWCRNEAAVIQTPEEAEAYEPPNALPVCVVSQTTFNYNKFQEIVAIFKQKVYYVSIVNTICNATIQHQKEAREISSNVDAMIVIGDTKSSNSRKLFEICQENCENTFFIQTANDLEFPKDAEYASVGITAGASTPNYIIEEVQKYASRIF